MKKLILVLVVLFSANVTVAQCCKTKTVCKKDSYVLNDGLIEAAVAYYGNGEKGRDLDFLSREYTKRSNLYGLPNF